MSSAEILNLVYAVLILAGIGALLAVGLAVASVKLHVEEDKRVEAVNNMLPGYNCGACGFPGCPGFAEAVVEEGVEPKLCKPAKADVIAEIKEYLKSVEASGE